MLKRLQLPLEKKRRKAQFIFKNDFKSNTATKYVKQLMKDILK